MTMHWDTSEVDRLAVDLSKAPGRMQRKASKVFAVGIFKAKQNLKDDASGHDYLPDLDRFVSYDKIGDLDYELGFDKVGQGNLANIAVYGSVNNSPIMGTPADALRHEMPAIMHHLGDEAEDAVLGTDKS